MKQDLKIQGLSKLGHYLQQFLQKSEIDYTHDEEELAALMRRSEVENPWFTQENIRFCFKNWADILTEENIKNWVSEYQVSQLSKKVGLILAGNIPLVGFHDVMCVILSNHIPLIKLSSKDRLLLPFFLKKWGEFSEWNLEFQIVERLTEYDAVIATGSNNTARYLEYYFKDALSIIRKNRTSVAVIKGDETDEELQLLAEDIFRYFGLGCRNVSKLFVPKDYNFDRFFKAMYEYKDVIYYEKYANNYDYNKAVFLMSNFKLLDNEFLTIKEDPSYSSPISSVFYEFYDDLGVLKNRLETDKEQIQCIVSNQLVENSIAFGQTQKPKLWDYADNVDTLAFLSKI